MKNYFSIGDDEELKFEEILTIEDNSIKEISSNDRKKENVITKLFDSISLKKQYTLPTQSPIDLLRSTSFINEKRSSPIRIQDTKNRNKSSYVKRDQTIGSALAKNYKHNED